ncbi:MAG: hypothetical protein J6M10_03665 [Clostridia bacterium]|nr:hypothetical protein [Clostridia bacterium]
MGYLPELIEVETYRMLTERFLGYDHNLKIQDGAWYEETNLTSLNYPLFSPRPRRAVVEEMKNPQGIFAKEALAKVEGETLYYNEQKVEGITLSTLESDCPKKMVGMGAYLCIFPDGVYVNTQDLQDCGTLAATFSAENAPISLQPCKRDGTEYELENVTVSTVAPTSPKNGQYWIDSSGEVHVLKQYSASSEMWVEIPTVYTKIGAEGIGEKFNALDGVRISNLAYTGNNETIKAQVEALNKDNIIQTKGDDFIIITGMIDQAMNWEGSVQVERRIPELDHVCELDNRLWGCHYGMADGVPVNELYASALGDPKVWFRFERDSAASYTIGVGSDGPFTGMISHLGYVLAFKEECVHKIYGTVPPFRVATTNCRGVQRGSERSLCAVNEKLYYKSRTDVCAYDGSLPVSISDAFAGVAYQNARAGAVGGKYYISMQDMAGDWHMFVYDVEKGIWHREDSTCAMMFTAYRDDIYYIDEENGFLMSALGKSGEKEGMVKWEAVSGIIGYEYPDHKYLSRFTLRVKMERHSWCEIWVQYDSDGEWIKQGDLVGANTQSFTVPVIPRRCDHMQIRIRGEGDVKIYSIAKILEMGSDE